MNLAALFDWWGETPIAHAMNSTAWTFPLVESIHMIGIVLFIGTVVLVDLRLVGLRFTRMRVSDLTRELAPWTLAGFITVIITGPLIVATDPDRYYVSPEFRFKMAALFLALLFDVTVHRFVRTRDVGPHRLVGGISLVLWTSVVVGGRLIGVFE